MLVNQKSLERMMRIGIGTLFLIAAYLYRDTIYIHAAWPGLILLATGILGWCPVYSLFGFSTMSDDTGRSGRP